MVLGQKCRLRSGREPMGVRSQERHKKLLVRGKISLGNIDFDEAGNPILARGFDLNSGEFICTGANPERDDWLEFYRQSEDSFEDFTVYGPDPEVPGNFIVSANNGADTTGLWSFNAATKKFQELLYQRKDVDICGVKYHSNSWTHSDVITGVGYCKGKIHGNFSMLRKEPCTDSWSN